MALLTPTFTYVYLSLNLFDFVFWELKRFWPKLTAFMRMGIMGLKYWCAGMPELIEGSTWTGRKKAVPPYRAAAAEKYGESSSSLPGVRILNDSLSTIRTIVIDLVLFLPGVYSDILPLGRVSRRLVF